MCLLSFHLAKLTEQLQATQGRWGELCFTICVHVQYLLPFVELPLVHIEHVFGFLKWGTLLNEVLLKTNVDLDVYALYLSWCRYRELQQKLYQLEQNTMQRDRTEALLKQKEKECIQVCTHKQSFLSLTSLGHLWNGDSLTLKNKQNSTFLNLFCS